MLAFCRDCHEVSVDGAMRCSACRSPRLLRHEELDTLSIAHIDCDAFYAAVEKRDAPELRDKPVIVGGGKRGVVSTCCYVARLSGVRSAMPMFTALKLCPEAVVIRPRMSRYVEVSRAVRTAMLEVTPQIEPLSLDEAFLDLSGTERVHRQPPAVTLAKLQRRIETDIGITVSVGLSYCKFLAKLASDIDKPSGFAVIGRAEAVNFLAGLKVERIWGVGKALQAKLVSDGITTIAHLQNRDLPGLVARYGSMGMRLYHFARGEDDRKVDTSQETKSVSSETTFDIDVTDKARLEATLWRQAERVSAQLKRKNLAGRTVVLKLKTHDFKLRTRSISIDGVTQMAERLYQAALPLLHKECDGTAYRLLGIGATNLGPPSGDADQSLDGSTQARAKVERIIDKVRERFGDAAIGKGRGLAASRKDAGKAPEPSASPSGRTRRNP